MKVHFHGNYVIVTADAMITLPDDRLVGVGKNYELHSLIA
jgi:hypothetical protein